MTDILYRLKEVNLISENFSPTSDEVTYTPTHDTNNITVGEMIARLESTPASDFALLGFSPKKHGTMTYIIGWEVYARFILMS